MLKNFKYLGYFLIEIKIRKQVYPGRTYNTNQIQIPRYQFQDVSMVHHELSVVSKVSFSFSKTQKLPVLLKDSCFTL